MYDLRLKNGDIGFSGDNVDTVSGREMITQELTTWLQEPLGSDKFHPRFGSSLHEYIGTPLYSEFVDEIETEVYRVVNSFARYYRDKYENDVMNGIRRYAPDDIVKSINSIEFIEKLDTVTVLISLSTFAGDITITREI